MDRKDFFKTAGFFCAVGVVGSVAFLESCKKAKVSTDPQGPTVNFTLDLSQSANSVLNTAGGSLAINGVIVANSGSGFVCVAQSCTHAGCNIDYHASSNDFVCPCHGGTYDKDGHVTSGPPPSPIKSYSTSLSGHILSVEG